MPRISVVVPIYDVEPYLATCLQSVAAQTVRDLEVVMVDDGSTDGSAAIAAGFARRDSRFRLLRQPNGGLGSARNTGSDAATGEFLAFVDSDDVLPPDAYERLLGALDTSGSDFATGNVHRLARTGTEQAAFLARTFARTRLGTHVTRFRALIADRTAWNKLWRRSFWDEHALRFPEGVVHEDIPVVVPAHFMARSVDVIAEPVYLWRTREDGAPSITQRRLERRVLVDRLAAIEHVSRYLAVHGPRDAKGWYDERLVADDLRLHLLVLGEADAGYRALFLERVNAFLDGADPGIYDSLTAIDRLAWHLVRRGLLPELLEVLRFRQEDLAGTPPVRIRRRWYGDYPFRSDRRLAIPHRVYRLGRQDANFGLNAHVDDVRLHGGAVTIRGHAHIEGVGAAARGFQRVSLTAVRPGRWRRVRQRIAGVRLETSATHRPDLAADGLAWSGFEATLDPGVLRAGRRWEDASWELCAHVRAGGLMRRRSRFVVDAPQRASAVDLPIAGEAIVNVAATSWGKITVSVATWWMTVASRRLDGEYLELAGEIRMSPGAKPTLEVRRESDSLTFTYPVAVNHGRTPGRFTARVLLSELRAATPGADEAVWELWAACDGHRVPLSFADGVPLSRSRRGGAALVEGAARPDEPQAAATAGTSPAHSGNQVVRT